MKVFAGFKFYGFLRGNLDGFSCLRISARSGLSLDTGKSAKPYQAELARCLELFRHSADLGFQGFRRCGFRNPRFNGHEINEICFCHSSYPPFVSEKNLRIAFIPAHSPCERLAPFPQPADSTLRKLSGYDIFLLWAAQCLSLLGL